MRVSQRGFFLQMGRHHFDPVLCAALSTLFRGMRVIDLGCGNGRYVDTLTTTGIETFGYDGNPFTNGFRNCFIADLSIRQELRAPVEAVLSLETGEHIPEEYEPAFIDNICDHSLNLVVLSWAIPGQKGIGHVNCKSNEYIASNMAKRNFIVSSDETSEIRSVATLPWLRKTLQVFRRLKHS
jgi:hypothetical protein